jgi:3-hydroxybutyryl-CoA dehydrogenase
MGAGIAQVSAVAGYDVVLADMSDAALDKGMGAISRSLDRFTNKGAVTSVAAAQALGRIRTTKDFGRFKDADVIVEAVPEDLELKTKVFAELDGIAKKTAVLASNTSAIPITRIAAATKRPEAVVGTHFFSPVPMMELCELVRGLRTSDATLAAARDFAEAVGKTCIVVNRDIAGFVTTRLITALANEAVRLVDSGVATAADIDIACKLGFGHAMGPLATTDLTGVDVMRNATLSIYNDSADPKYFPPELLTRMVAAGDLGRKSGRGFYQYGE